MMSRIHELGEQHVEFFKRGEVGVGGLENDLGDVLVRNECIARQDSVFFCEAQDDAVAGVAWCVNDIEGSVAVRGFDCVTVSELAEFDQGGIFEFSG
ncbi:hypothetical protein BC936DRAFT_140390 [Jimgerdemannia flammicorona]|uniref:Uncharacterized protein n=1 Tax=Jimgerdemannia flammicorona TaxID=994334 RepID=A0A433DH20_9FUNG|nr:hypothetical protein BC936DRAFT_140390 [Jimgerdemannia flammicorona]